MKRLPPSRLAVLLLSLAALACQNGDLVIPPTPAQIDAVQGNGQLGSPGSPLSQPLVVRVLDEQGKAIAGVPVAFELADQATGGSVTPDTALTDSRGEAAARWTLGISGPQAVNAQVVGVPLSVTFTAMSGSAANLPSATQSTVSADPSSIAAGTGISTITVRVLDAAGDPVGGATVSLQADGTGNTLTQPSSATGPDGIAVGTLSSAVPGTKVISAVVNGSVPLTQTVQVTVTPAPTLRLESIEGDDQNTPAGNDVPIRPAVRVTDDQGQPVAGVTVTFVVTGGGGSVLDAVQTTNSDGIARVGGWRLGTSPGTNTLEARAGSIEGSPVVFTAEGSTSGGVDHLVFVLQPNNVKEREFFTVEVALVDAAGNLVRLSGIEIYLGLFPDGSPDPDNRRLLGDRFRDTQDGVAVFNLAVNQKGTYRFRALTDELPALGVHGPEPYLFSQPFTVH